jgi:hypothetical protein
MFKQGVAVTGPPVVAPMIFMALGCITGLIGAVVSFMALLLAGVAPGLAALIAFVVLLVLAVGVASVGSPVAIALSVHGLFRIDQLVRTGRWPSYYMGVSDRRLLLLGADSWSKKPKPDDFWSCGLGEVQCVSYQDVRFKVFVGLRLRGELRDYVIDWHFRPLAEALARLGATARV